MLPGEVEEEVVGGGGGGQLCHVILVRSIRSILLACSYKYGLHALYKLKTAYLGDGLKD